MILVVAEQQKAELKPSLLATLTAAKAIDEQLVVLMVGPGSKQAVQNVSGYAGVKKAAYCDQNCFNHILACDLADLIVSYIDNQAVSHIVMASCSLGKDCLPRVAAKLGSAQITDVIEVVDSKTYRRPIFAGNAIAKVRSNDAIQCLTVRSTAFEQAVEVSSNCGDIDEVAFTCEQSHTCWQEDSQSDSDRPELSDAKVVISGGRGLKDQETFALLADIAKDLGAAMGASRAAVDAELVPNELQVGQTGQVVAPDLYIAVGISGAIQHLAGMKDSKVIVAINSDPDAPIFEVADYGLVADLFEVLPKLKQHLARG